MNEKISKYPSQQNLHMLDIGVEILGLNPHVCIKTRLDAFRSNFKYSPTRCWYIFLLIRKKTILPSGYEPKHVLWTMYFLTTYATERRLCFILHADRATIRKYTWPTIAGIAHLSRIFASNLSSRHSSLCKDFLT